MQGLIKQPDPLECSPADHDCRPGPAGLRQCQVRRLPSVRLLLFGRHPQGLDVDTAELQLRPIAETCHLALSFSGCQQSSESLKATSSPTASVIPAFRAAATPEFSWRM